MSGTGRGVPTGMDISQIARWLVYETLPENRDDVDLLSQDL